MRKYLILLLLTGCAPLGSYQPKLASAPANEEKYQADLADCIHKVEHPPVNGFYAFGLLGGAAAEATNQDPMYDDWSKPTTRVDACMKERGYAINSNS